MSAATNPVVSQHPQTFAACGALVGRAPGPGAPSGDDPLVGLLEHTKRRTRGSGADVGVRPTFGCGLCCIVGQAGSLRRVGNPPGGSEKKK